MQPSGESVEIGVTEECRQALVVAATTTRIASHVLAALGDPEPNSPLSIDDALYPWEKATAWLRQYVSASLDNLGSVAQSLAPLEFAEGSRVRLFPRALFTLGRAAIESAAQAAWILAPRAARERAERHVRLLYTDFGEQAKCATAAGEMKSAEVARDRQESLVARLVNSLDERAIRSGAPSYLDVVRSAAPRVDRSPADLEVVWRTASAAAHGKGWFVYATHDVVVGEEYEPGHFRAISIPREEALADVLGIAAKLAHVTVLRYSEGLGCDWRSLDLAATERAFRESPMKPGGEVVVEETLERMRRLVEGGDAAPGPR